MVEEDTRKLLDGALASIRSYQEKTLCGWCKRSSEKIGQAIDDLKSLHEYGERFVVELQKKEGFKELPEEATRLATLRALAEGKKVVTSSLHESKSLFTKSILPSRNELFGTLFPTPVEIFDLVRPPLPHEVLALIIGGE